MVLHAMTLALLVVAPRPAPPTIDVALRRLCEAGSVWSAFCEVFTTCGPVRKGTCSGTDRAQKQPEEDWRTWKCDLDLRNGYLSCTEETHVTTGPGEGDVVSARWEAALFVGKGAALVAVAVHGDRPEAKFFSKTAEAWTAAEPLPKLTPAVFALKEPHAPKPQTAGFRAEFFVELELPREGTTITATGRWVNTFRDDSGYGQSDTELSHAALDLAWNAATSTFVVQR
jgi:hypothetical protein